MKQAWLWKTIPTLAICVFVWVNFDLKPTDPIPFMGVSLDYKPGVKAAIFAITSASLFIVSWIQTNPTILGRAADWLNRLASGITAILTGWYWLASEARETSEEHLVLQLQICGERFQAAFVMAEPGYCLVPPSPPGPQQH